MLRRARWFPVTALLSSCGGGGVVASAAFEAPVATVSSLVYTDALNDELVFVAPGEDAINVSRRGLEESESVVAWARPTLDGSGVFAMAVPRSEKTENVDEELYLFDANGESDPERWSVGAPFDGLAQSPDLRHVVLYFSGSSDTSSPLQNANLVTILDLERGEFEPVTLNGFGGRLASVEFPGAGAEVEVGGVDRNLVVFLAEGEVVLVDMNAPRGNQVAFSVDGFDPQATLLRNSDDMVADPLLFIRASSSSDVAMLRLIEKVEDDEDILSTTVSMLSVGRAHDFALYDGDDVPYLITLSNDRDVTFTDIETQEGFVVELPSAASRLFVREHEVEGKAIRQLVAWKNGSQALYTLDLDDIESTLGRTPHQLKIESGIQELVRLDDDDRVLIGSGSTLYVVDFPRDLVTPLTAASTYDPSSAVLSEDHLLLGSPGQRYVSSVDLVALHPESMLLDKEIVSFHYFEKSRRIVTTHEGAAGYITVVDADELSRSTSYGVWGFLFEGGLERD